MKDTMWRNAGLVRDETRLREEQAQLAEIREGVKAAGCPGDPAYNLAWADILNMENYLDVSDAIVNGALARKESRGSHYRSDFPERDDGAYLCNFVVTKDRPTPVGREVALTRMKPEDTEKVGTQEQLGTRTYKIT